MFSFPSMEMFNEVKLISSTYAAENGRFGGGVEVYNTRSGTNKFHGTGAYNFRRHWLNAAGYNVNSNPRQSRRAFGRSRASTPRAAASADRFGRRGSTTGATRASST